MKIAQAATLVGKPTSPKKPLLLALGFVLALGAALATPLVAEMLDETLRSADEVESELNLPVLLTLPPCKSRVLRGKSPLRKSVADRLAGECFHTLAQELVSRNGAGNGHAAARAVGVVGCECGASRSDVAAELAIEAAECCNQSVLLIDADEQHRKVAERFGLNGSPGWREVLAGTADPQSCVHPANDGRLAVMTSGQSSRASMQSPASAGDIQLNELKQKYGLVVVDLPTASVINARAGAGWLDESLLVVEAEHTRIQSAQRAKAQLERAGIRVAGVVLANEREHMPRWLHDRL